MTPSDENENALLLGFLKVVIDRHPAGGAPKSRYPDRFDRREVDGAPLAQCRRCRAHIHAVERDASKSWEWNTSTARWIAGLDKHVAVHAAAPETWQDVEPEIQRQAEVLDGSGDLARGVWLGHSQYAVWRAAKLSSGDSVLVRLPTKRLQPLNVWESEQEQEVQVVTDGLPLRD